jgi:hypothetical protein
MTREEVTLQFGTDTTQVPFGLDQATGYITQWEEKKKNVERGYTGWWAGELAKREELEIASAKKVIAEKAALQAKYNEEFFANQAAQHQIAQGSIPSNLVRDAETAGAAGVGARLARAGGKMAEEGVEHAAKAGALSEGFVIVREALRGNFSRMAGSISRFIGLISSAALAITAEIGIPLAIIAGPSAYKAYRARQAAAESGKDLTEFQRGAGEQADTRIEALVRAGRLDPKTAEQYRKSLKNPDAVSGVLSSLGKLMPKGGLDELLQEPEKKRLDEEHTKKMAEWKREDMTAGQRATEDMMRQSRIKSEMAYLDKDSVAYKQKQLELDEAIRDGEKDAKEVAQQKTEQDKKQAELSKVKAESALRISEIHQHEAEKFLPTLEELAHHGIFGSQARSINRLDRRIKREFEHGDVSGANTDIGTRNKIYDSLAARGVLAERSEAREIRDLNKQMAIRLQAMGTPNSPMVITPKLK